jgi:hypothetical protein
MDKLRRENLRKQLRLQGIHADVVKSIIDLKIEALNAGAEESSKDLLLAAAARW